MKPPARIAVVAALLAQAPPAVVAQPRPAAPGPSEAREQFGVIVQAAGDLAAVLAAGRNLRGGLQSWDRRWRSRLRSLGRVVLPADASGGACEPREVVALVDGTAQSVWNARMFLFSEGGASLVPLARELAARRIVADEAQRRRARGASCADLPELSEAERSLGPASSSATDAPTLLQIARRGRGR